MSSGLGEQIGAYAGGILGGAAGEFFGPEAIPIGASLGSQAGKFIGKKGEEYIVKASKQFMEDLAKERNQR